MLVIIDKYPLDTSLFRNCIINERLNLVYFIHRPKGMEGELQLPILFENACDTRRSTGTRSTTMTLSTSSRERRGSASSSTSD